LQQILPFILSINCLVFAADINSVSINLWGISADGSLMAWQEDTCDGESMAIKLVIAGTMDHQVLEVIPILSVSPDDPGLRLARKKMKALGIVPATYLEIEQDVYGQYAQLPQSKGEFPHELRLYLKIDPSLHFYRLEISDLSEDLSSCKALSKLLYYNENQPFKVSLTGVWINSNQDICVAIVEEDYYSDGHQQIDRIYAISTWMTIGFD